MKSALNVVFAVLLLATAVSAQSWVSTTAMVYDVCHTNEAIYSPAPTVATSSCSALFNSLSQSRGTLSIACASSTYTSSLSVSMGSTTTIMAMISLGDTPTSCDPGAKDLLCRNVLGSGKDATIPAGLLKQLATAISDKSSSEFQTAFGAFCSIVTPA
eukprot:ANDGO_08044.mRNA.1 hypothetical protein